MCLENHDGIDDNNYDYSIIERINRYKQKLVVL